MSERQKHRVEEMGNRWGCERDGARVPVVVIFYSGLYT